MNEDTIGCLVCLIGFIVVCGLTFGVNNQRCAAKATALGYEHDFKVFQGCVLIKPDGKKVLLEQLRDFDR